ncbi:MULTISPECIES: alpha/beta hydrolase [Actinomadura]|uniref:Alpha/beta hydrolase fold domain-containing protein n=1 Tax=Actinomadura yumaensis TaxID=111807 RepID=A0ABW2CGV2_9ACTN|nr:alpha/beta hydrolase [Actinomadura sp. J1-007]MWK39955.1 alpha/beta hydrolase fold domain-containing protein [Actinomadura sp. J1-007]
MSRRHAVRVKEGLRYASPQGTDLFLDLYIPEPAPAPGDGPEPGGGSEPGGGPGAPPVVLYLHGGGWLTGARGDHAERLVRLAEHGVAVASADYRFAHVAPFPAQLHDVRTAVRWLRREGPAHGLAAGRVGVWGASAGAQLAAHLAVASAGDDPGGDYGHGDGCEDGAVQAMAGYFGAYDVTARSAEAVPNPALPVPEEIRAAVWPAGLPVPPSARLRHALLAGVAEADLGEEHLRALSPVHHVGRGCPPLFLLHGTGDAIVSAQQSRWLAEAARQAGATARVVLLDGANHEDPAFDAHEIVASVAEFFLGHLVC